MWGHHAGPAKMLRRSGAGEDNDTASRPSLTKMPLRCTIYACPRRTWVDFCWPTRRLYPPTLPLLAPADLPWVTAWTDGAGSHLAPCGIARAAWAVHFGPGQRSWSGSVCGPQSVQRAELFSAVISASVSAGPLLVVTDSQYVARGVQRLRGRPSGSTRTSGICCGLRQRRAACRPAGCLFAAMARARLFLCLVDWEGTRRRTG